MAPVVFLGGDGHQAFEVSAGQGRGLGLGEAEVGGAEGADVAVAPVLAADPLLGVVAVVGLADVGLPHAVGVVASAAVLHDDGVAVFEEASGPLDEVGVLVVVDGPEQEGREGASLGGLVDVGGELDAVAHGDSDVEADAWGGHGGTGYRGTGGFSSGGAASAFSRGGGSRG